MLIHSKSVYFFCILCNVCSLIIIIGLASLLIYLSIGIGESKSKFGDFTTFHPTLFHCVIIELISSFIQLWISAYFQYQITTKNVQRIIPFWCGFNVIFFYVSIGCVLFPYLESESGHTKIHKVLQNWILYSYFGLLASQVIALTGFITSLYEYRHRLQEMCRILRTLNLGKPV